MIRVLICLSLLFFTMCSGKGELPEKPVSESDKKLVDKADKLSDEGKYEDALEELEKVDSPSLWSEYLTGYCHLELEEFDKALKKFEVVFDQKRDYLHTAYNMVNCLMGSVRDEKVITEEVAIKLEVSVELMSIAINAHKDRLSKHKLARYYSKRGTLYKDLQNYEMAVTDYNHAIRYDQKALDFKMRGECYQQIEMYGQACEDFQKAISMGETIAQENLQVVCESEE